MKNKSLLINELRSKLPEFLIPMQTTKVVEHEVFEEIYLIVQDLMRSLSGEDLVSKSLLDNLYLAIGMIRAEAPYHGENQGDLEDKADKLEYYFSLILKNEVPEDRVPGVPRII